MKERDPKRIERMLAKLRLMWLKYPDLRIGQIIDVCNEENIDTFYVEDDAIEAMLDKQLLQFYKKEKIDEIAQKGL